MPHRILMAVVFPIPFGPRIPVTSPFFGTGRRYRRNEFRPYWCIRSVFSSSARPMILTASNWHLFTQMPHPWQRVSDMIGFPFSPNVTHSTPVLFRGQNLAHSWLHFLFWHLSFRTAAIRMAVAIGCLYL